MQAERIDAVIIFFNGTFLCHVKRIAPVTSP